MQDVTWTRTELSDLFAQGNIKPQSRNKTKAIFLQKTVKKFKDIPLLVIQEMLDSMREHSNRQRQQFVRNYAPIPSSDPIIYASTTRGEMIHTTRQMNGRIGGLTTQNTALKKQCKRYRSKWN
eukprot:143614_1